MKRWKRLLQNWKRKKQTHKGSLFGESNINNGVRNRRYFKVSPVPFLNQSAEDLKEEIQVFNKLMGERV